MKNNKILLYFTLVGIVLGGFCGWFYGSAMNSVAWIGEMFLDILKMLVVPLIISSMIVGITGLGDIRKIGKTGLITFGYYMLTTAFAAAIGLIMVNLLQPGVGVDTESLKLPENLEGREASSLEDIIRSFVAPNLIKAMVEFDILPLIVFSLIFGGVLTTMGEGGRKVIDFFDVVNQAIMKMVHLVMFLAPLGVFALIASKLGAAGGGDMFFAELTKMGKYVVTVVLGLLIHGALVIAGLLVLFTGRNPLTYVRNAGGALLTAFSTASSSATLPLTIECAEEENKVSRQSALFVLPLGATMNMDGTAMYESVAAIFIAQMYGIDLSLGDQAVIFMTATLASIGAAGIPEAGLVTMVMVLQAVGLPLEGIGMLLAIDWFLDRCRTTINVWGDSVGAAVVDSLEQKYVEGGIVN